MINSSVFAQKLMVWYRRHARALPWRKTKDPYKIWISEVMLQQTTVKAVIPYYLRWIKLFPTVGHVARAPLQKILRCWQGLGYYARAKNIQKSAKIILRNFYGKIPNSFDELKELPGFGPYTTGAVLSIAFNKKHTIIDANVRRVVMRLLALRGFSDTSKDKKISDFLRRIIPDRKVGDFNQALMELGALVCRSPEPLCGRCPISQHCLAFKQGIQEIIPRLRKSYTKDIQAVVAVIEKNGKYLIQKRPSKGLLADLWEFPGGKIERGESSETALKREINEELGVNVLAARQMFDIIHFYTQFRVKLGVYACKLDRYPSDIKNRRWVSYQSLSRFPMPSGSARIIDKLTAKITT